MRIRRRDGGGADTAHRAAAVLAAGAVLGLLGCTTDFRPHGPRCGDGVAEADEACDGSDLAGVSCADFGAVGALACRADCTLDTTACLETCGDGVLDPGEACDGSALGGATCQGVGFHEGTLACRTDCTFDTTACLGRCGDQAISGPEDCDGTALGDATCETLGYYTGTLSCDEGCAFDTTACLGRCGDDLINGSEACDGVSLGGHLCSDYGYAGGTLACAADCTFEYGGCWTEPRVVVNEIFAGIPDWLELRNVSEVPVDLQGWGVEWTAVQDTANNASGSIALPAYTLAAGERVVLQESGTTSGDPPTISPGLILFHSNISWGTQGGTVTVRNPSLQVLDFVRFGRSTTPAPAGATWDDAEGALPSPGLMESDMSLSRLPEAATTGSATDFCVASATPGGPNAGPCRTPFPPGTVLLTEVDVSNPERVELYNPGAAPVDLGGWRLRVSAATQATRLLPSHTLAPGAYVAVHTDAADPASPYADGAGLHVGSLNLATFGGFVVLIEPETHGGVDFVRWGSSNTLPMVPDAWANTPAALPTLMASPVIGRQTLVDTDTAGDWCLQNPSLGAPNGPCL